jgi:hypothetical protein
MTTTPEAITFDPMTQSLAEVIPGAKAITLDEAALPATFDPLDAEPTCDRVRDLMKDDLEFAGKVILTCDKPLGHDRRGGHRMRNEAGKTTCTWTGPADND